MSIVHSSVEFVNYVVHTPLYFVILNINITDNNKKNIETVTKQLKTQFKYLKLKSANIDKDKSNYVFWYEIEEKNIENFLKTIKEICDENLNVSIYSKTGAFE